MRKLLSIIFVMLFCAQFSVADIFIKSVTRTDTYAGGEVKSSKETAESTIWIGKDRIAYNTPDFKIILNKKENRFFFSNAKRKTYVEASVPLDMALLLSEDLKLLYGAGKTTGTVRETGETRKIKDFDCKEYEVKYWKTYDETPTDRLKIKVLAAKEAVPDLSLHDEMLDYMRMIFNRDEKLRKELQKINGIQMYLEVSEPRGDTEVRYIEEVIEISDREPPEGVYSVPEGYKKEITFNKKDF